MRDLLREARQRLAREIDTRPAPLSEPIVADPWIVSSLLQKSIRRGESGIAQRAALTLFRLRGSAIWRRFMVIAFEDVGAGSVHAVMITVAAGSDAAWRNACGGDSRVAAYLAKMLAEAPKDRSADYLACAKDHPSLVDFAQAMANRSVQDRLSIMRGEISRPATKGRRRFLRLWPRLEQRGTKDQGRSICAVRSVCKAERPRRLACRNRDRGEANEGTNHGHGPAHLAASYTKPSRQRQQRFRAKNRNRRRNSSLRVRQAYPHRQARHPRTRRG